jgi:hypothetical protein
MAEVQRWLVVTQRRPTPMEPLFVAWVADGCELDPIQAAICGTLPRPLFVQLNSDDPGYIGVYAPGIFLYESLQHAENALEKAWEKARRANWFGRRWEPGYEGVGESKWSRIDQYHKSRDQQRIVSLADESMQRRDQMVAVQRAANLRILLEHLSQHGKFLVWIFAFLLVLFLVVPRMIIRF